MTRRALALLIAAAATAHLAPVATAQATSAGPAARPHLRGKSLPLRDELRKSAPTLVGLEQSETAYRADLPIDRSPLATAATMERKELRERQLAIHSGATVAAPPPRFTAPAADAPARRAAPASEGRGSPRGFARLFIAALLAALLGLRVSRRLHAVRQPPLSR